MTDILAQFWPIVAALFGGVVMLITSWRAGRKSAKTEAENDDHENAADIRNRVERELPDRVREMDGRGFRDD